MEIDTLQVKEIENSNGSVLIQCSEKTFLFWLTPLFLSSSPIFGICPSASIYPHRIHSIWPCGFNLHQWYCAIYYFSHKALYFLAFSMLLFWRTSFLILLDSYYPIICIYLILRIHYPNDEHMGCFKILSALAGVAQWIEQQTANQKVFGLIPG